MHLRFLAVLLAFLAAAPAAGQSSQTYRSAGGFAVEVPAEWVQMPDEALDVVRQSGLGGDMDYEAVFKLSNAPWPAPPVFGIARLDLPEEMTLEEFGAEFSAPDAQEQVQAGLDDTAPGEARARVNVPRWDPATRSGWMRISFKSDGSSPAYAVSAFTLAPSGRAMIVVVYFGALHSDPARAQAELEAVVRSLRPA